MRFFVECAFPYLRKRGVTSREGAVCTRRLTQKRTLHPATHGKAQSAPGDSRQDALWGSHSHGKVHFACGPHQKTHSVCERWRKVRLSVRVRAQNALFRRMCFSLPAQTSGDLTEKRTLQPLAHGKAHSGVSLSRKTAFCTGDSRKDALCRCHPHVKAHSAPATPPRRDQKAHSGRATSRKSAFCMWASPKSAFCKRAVAQSAPFREGPCAECAFP